MSAQNESMFRLAGLSALLLIAACNTPRGFLGGSNPRDKYAQSLQSAGLATSAMVLEWQAAGGRSLNAPQEIGLPYREAGFFSPQKPGATGLRFRVPRGQTIRISLAIRPDSGARLFTELWRQRPGGEPELLESPEGAPDTLRYEVERDGEHFILRLQPELLIALSYTVHITTAPSLAFPVKGGGPGDIGSIWGDPRDAGARKHEGIDIFGRKRAPVVAAAEGTVTRVEESGLGGKVVWMRPEGKPLSLYYAHLDTQLVSPGQRVRTGAILGLMGNTGNARGTATHLHFGIYGGGGAVNPYYFVAGGSGAAPAVSAPAVVPDSLYRATGRIQLYATAAMKEGKPLAAGSALRPQAVSGKMYRVSMPDGREGWVYAGHVTQASLTLRTIRNEHAAPLYHIPDEGAAIVAELPPGSAVRIMAHAGNWLYGAWNGRTGWLQAAP